ncbi:MAG: cell division protein FtsL [Selenomonadaceae bacterium]
MAAAVRYQDDFDEENIGGGARTRRARRVKKKKSSMTLPRPHINAVMRSRALILVVVLSVCLSIMTLRSMLLATRGYELVQMQNAATQLENENKQLNLQIAHLRAPQRIRDIATNDLGMVVPKNVYFAAEKQ